MVHSPAKSDRDIVSEATQTLERSGAPLLGLIFNNISQKSYYPMQWPYGYAPTSSSKHREEAFANHDIIEVRPSDRS